MPRALIKYIFIAMMTMPAIGTLSLVQAQGMTCVKWMIYVNQGRRCIQWVNQQMGPPRGIANPMRPTPPWNTPSYNPYSGWNP